MSIIELTIAADRRRLPGISAVFRRSLALLAFVALTAIPTAPIRASTWLDAITGGLWNNSTNWSAGIPNGVGAIADFSTLNITADNTVHMDGSETVGSLVFGDNTTASNNWILDNNGSSANVLTLSVSSGITTITVNNEQATIGAVIAGTQGLTIIGPGTLVLSGSAANTYSGLTTVSSGTLVLNKQASTNAVPGNLTIGAANGGASATVQLASSNQIGDTATVTVNPTGLLNIPNGTQDYVSTLVLNGGNVSTGTVAFTFLGFVGNSGQIQTIGNSTTSTINGVLNLNDDSTHLTTFNIASGATSGIDLDVSASVQAGGVVKTGGGAMRFTGNNTFSSGLAIQQGNLIVNTVSNAGSGGPLGANASVTLGSIGQTGTLELAGGSVASNMPFTLAAGGTGAFQVDVTATNLTLTGVISGGGGLIKNGPGTLTLGVTNSFTGGVTINGGMLTLTSGGALNSASPNAVAVNSPALLNLNGLNVTLGALSLSGGTIATATGSVATVGAINILASPQTATITGNLNMGGGKTISVAAGTTSTGIDFDVPAVVFGGMLTKTGAGALRLSGANVNEGVNLSAGTLVVGSDSVGTTSGPVGTSLFTIASDATLEGDAASLPHTLTNSVSLSGGIAFVDGVQNLTLNGDISGPGGLTKNGTGTLTLGGASSNSYSGSTTINSGVLALNKTGIPAVGGSGLIIGNDVGGAGTAVVRLMAGGSQISASTPVRINGSGLLDMNGVGDTLGAVTLSGGSIDTGASDFRTNNAILTTLASSQTATISGLTGRFDLLTGRTFTVAAGTTPSGIDLDVSVVLFDSGLTKNGAGVLRLSGKNASFSHGLTLDAGTVLIANDSALGTGTLSMANGTMIQADGGAHTVSNSVSLASGTATIGGGQELTLNGVISGSGVLAKTGSGLLRLSNASNSWTGGLTLSAGTLAVGDSAALSSGALVINGGAVQADGAARNPLNAVAIGGDFTVGGSFDLTLSGPATLTGNRTITVNNANAIFSGGIGQDVVGRTLTKAGSGNLSLSGSDTFTKLIISAGTVTQDGALLSAAVINQAAFIYNGGTFGGRLTNFGTVAVNADFTAADGMENDAGFSLATGRNVILNGAGLDNEGSFGLAGGTLSGSGPLMNDNTLFGNGAIAGSGGFTNNAFVNVSGGSLKLTNSGSNYNYGEIMLSSGEFLQLGAGVSLTNASAISLNGGLISGAGTLANIGGSITGPGVISANLSNVSGVIIVGNGNNLTIVHPWYNGGIVELTSLTSNVTGGAVTNYGTIQGLGAVSCNVTNSGSVEAAGGTLTLAGPATNSAAGTLNIDASSKLVITNGLITNAGTILNQGGTFDNNGFALSNTGVLAGFGVFRTGGAGLTNNGGISFTGGATSVIGPVTNQNGRTITVAYNPALFTGMVTNVGGATFNILNTTATFAGGFTNAGSSNFAKAGGGEVDITAAPTLNSKSALSVTDGILKFDIVSSTPSIGTGVTATVAGGATLELAGSVSALASGGGAPAPAGRVGITNDSSAAGIVVSGTNQQVGNIDGSGVTRINAGSDLTADHIVQNGLVIGGSAAAPGKVTIAASDPEGQPIDLALDPPTSLIMVSLLPEPGPLAVDSPGLASMNSPNGLNGAGDSLSAVFPAASARSTSGSAVVPEPSAFVLVSLGGALALVARLRSRARSGILAASSLAAGYLP